MDSKINTSVVNGDHVEAHPSQDFVEGYSGRLGPAGGVAVKVQHHRPSVPQLVLVIVPMRTAALQLRIEGRSLR